MNILQVVSTLSPRAGGPAKAVVDLSRELARQGERVSIFSADCGPEEPDSRTRFQEGNVEICRFGPKWPGHYGYSPLFAQELKRRIKDFDIVHIHGLWTYPTFAAGRISRKERVPYLIRPCGMLDEYCIGHHRLRKTVYYFLAERKNLISAQAVHFTHETERDRSFGGNASLRSVVIPLGCDLSDFADMPPRGNFKNRYAHLHGKKIVSFLGRLNFKKGLDLLIDAVAELKKSVQDVHCVIAGPDDEGYGSRLKRWIHQKGMAEDVTFTGFLNVDQKRELFGDSEVFCLPSHQENFGIAVVEAMACALPVVVSDQVSLSKEIQSVEAGIVTRLKVFEIASALKQLLQHDSLKRRMGEQGRNLVRDKYRWEPNARRLIRLYGELVQTNHR